MERVQFEQEQMLAELKDFGEKGLFSAKEIKHIVKKRTAFETALVRRIPNKNDYLRYAAYEMGLEALRRKRVARLKLPKSPPSISDHALMRRQYHIFERALQKFKSDVSLWLQYLRVAQRAGARSLAGRIAARAVQLHPRTPALYVLAAAHELGHGGMGAARVLLQRGLRLNADSVEMWREYVRLELGFVEAVRRRWELLGIEVEEASGERVDRAEEVAMGDEARRSIMDGAIVRQAIDSAAKALPRIELFRNLQSLIAGYPTPETLRRSLLDHLHVRLAEALPEDAASVVLRATRALAIEEEKLSDVGLVEALRCANEEMLAALEPPSEGMAKAYAKFVEEWFRKEDLDAHLKLYLIGSLGALIKRQSETPPSVTLLALHVRLLQDALDHLPSPPCPPSRILRLARRYTSTTTTTAGTAQDLWLARLRAESVHGTRESVLEAWTSARKTLPTCVEIWLWGADRCCPPHSPSWEEFDGLLAESMRDAALRDVHQSLLLFIAESMGSVRTTTEERRARVEHIARRCLPSSKVWARIFAVLAKGSEESEEGLLREVYEYWCGTGEVEDSTLAWARWLLVTKKRGDEAMKVILAVAGRARHGDGSGSFATLAQQWSVIVRRHGKEENDGDDDDDDDDDGEPDLGDGGGGDGGVLKMGSGLIPQVV